MGSLIKYYIKVTCALKWARKLPRNKTEIYESAKCVPCNTRKCPHNGFVSELLKWALKCRFYATGPWSFADFRLAYHIMFFLHPCDVVNHSLLHHCYQAQVTGTPRWTVCQHSATARQKKQKRASNVHRYYVSVCDMPVTFNYNRFNL